MKKMIEQKAQKVIRHYRFWFANG